MRTRLLFAVGTAALLLSTASAPAASSLTAGAGSGAALIAFCPGGTEVLGIAAPTGSSTETLFADPSLMMLDAALSSLPRGCDGFLLAPALPGGAGDPAPGSVSTQDAAVWSRGTPPAVRASDAP